MGAFYLVGIPVALVAGFALHLGGAGFWIGMIAGGATQVTLLTIITAMTNWRKMVGSSFLVLLFYASANERQSLSFLCYILLLTNP